MTSSSGGERRCRGARLCALAWFALSRLGRVAPVESTVGARERGVIGYEARNTIAFGFRRGVSERDSPIEVRDCICYPGRDTNGSSSPVMLAVHFAVGLRAAFGRPSGRLGRRGDSTSSVARRPATKMPRRSPTRSPRRHTRCGQARSHHPCLCFEVPRRSCCAWVFGGSGDERARRRTARGLRRGSCSWLSRGRRREHQLRP